MKVYKINWDSNDSRFTYYDDMIVTSVEEWKKEVVKACYRDAKFLRKIFLEIDYFEKGEVFETNFDAWIVWCIENFADIEEIEINNYDANRD